MTTLVPGSMINQTTLFTSGSLYSGNINTGNIATGNVSVTGTLPPPVGIYANDVNSLALATNSAARLIVDATGQVGIGTAAGTTLDVYGQTRIKQTSESAAITSAANFYIQRFTNDSRMTLAYATAPDAWVIKTSYGSTGSYKPLVLATSDTERMRITNTGNVGVGNTGPVSKLQVTGATQTSTPTLGNPSGTALILNNTDSNYGWTFGVAPSGKSWAQSMRVDGTATAYDLLLQPVGGFVGIGTSAATGTLDVWNRGITKGSMPVGSILQVQQTVYQAQNNTSTTSYTSLTSVSITPSSATSRILIQLCMFSSGSGAYQILRNATPVLTPSVTYQLYSPSGAAWNSGSNRVPYTAAIIDTPGTTSAVTYNVYWAAYQATGVTFGINEGGPFTVGGSTVTAWEIAA